jgi:hypothetical protein
MGFVTLDIGVRNMAQDNNLDEINSNTWTQLVYKLI